MQTITNSAVRTSIFAFAALLLLAVPFAFAPKAHATDLFGDGGFDYIDTYTPDYGGGYDYIDTYTPDYSSYDSYGGYTSPSYSYPNYTQPNYTRPNYTQPNYTRPNYTSPSYTAPSYTNTWDNGNTYTYAPSNTETCTATNSCNDNSYRDNSVYSPTTIVTDSHNITDSHNVYNPYPVTYPAAPVASQTQTIYVSAPVTPTYQQPAYQPTYQPAYQPRVAYNNPAISLAAVPYTGLDLGPWGTAVYWGFLVLWCASAAYLIAVKKVQNKFVTWLMGGNSQPIAQRQVLGSPSGSAQPDHAARQQAAASIATKPQFAGIDPFIASQISRAS